MIRAVGLLLAVLLSVAACAPRYAPPGPADRDPALVLETDSVFVTSDGLRLPLRVWLPAEKPRAIVLALHGLGDYGNAFSGQALGFTAAGVGLVAYDQRGFGASPSPGLWPGQDRLVEDLREAAEEVHRRFPGVPLYLLGESMGGAVVLAAQGSDRPADVAGIILAAPAVWARSTQPWYQRAALWMAVRLFPGWKPTGEGLNRMPSDNMDMLRKLAADPLVQKAFRIDLLEGVVNLMDSALAAGPHIDGPVLLLYGQHDQIVPRQPIERLWASLSDDPQARFVDYPDGWHMLLRDLQGATVLADILAWIKEPQGPLPSGFERGRAAGS